jgi:LmbE family N-acetylglucosaminyl deacetylase
MATLVFFHAHPDDESILTGGSMAKAASEGHRVVLVVATRGEHGEVADGFLAAGEQLGVRRVAETFASAEVLGVRRVEFLGYVDSGMMGEPTNEAPYSFWSADVDAAANRLATILREEGADALITYDDNGGYGHPDHIKVNRVGNRAGEIAGVRTFEATMNRDRMIEGMTQHRAEMEAEGMEMPDFDLEQANTMGKAEVEITHEIDVSSVVEAKRLSMKAHPSQIPDDSWFLSMPTDVFARAFGTESYIEVGRRRDGGQPMATSLLDP